MKNSKTNTTLALSALVFGSLASASVCANGNPFSAQELSAGYEMQTFEGKCGEGKCGEGKCGNKKELKDKAKEAIKDKAKEGKCGEGKCGEGMCGNHKADELKDKATKHKDMKVHEAKAALENSDKTKELKRKSTDKLDEIKAKAQEKELKEKAKRDELKEKMKEHN